MPLSAGPYVAEVSVQQGGRHLRDLHPCVRRHNELPAAGLHCTGKPSQPASARPSPRQATHTHTPQMFMSYSDAWGSVGFSIFILFLVEMVSTYVATVLPQLCLGAEALCIWPGSVLGLVYQPSRHSVQRRWSIIIPP